MIYKWLLQVHKHARCSRKLSATTSDSRGPHVLLAAAQMCRVSGWNCGNSCLHPSPTYTHPRTGSVIGQIADLTARSSPVLGQATAWLWLMEEFGLRNPTSHHSCSPPKPALDDPPMMRRVSSLREHLHRNWNTVKVQEQIKGLSNFPCLSTLAQFALFRSVLLLFSKMKWGFFS